MTTSLFSAMMLTARSVFHKVKLINYLFHVQQLMSWAVDQMRITFRLEVLDAENKVINKIEQSEELHLQELKRKLSENGNWREFLTVKPNRRLWHAADISC